MQRFCISLLGCMVSLNAMAGAYLPVVDVDNGRVSARAAFGEELPVKNNVVAEPMIKPVEKKVVSRSAKKPVQKEQKIAYEDVLQPRRPSSDLWARSDTPLRMPRMDEIAVVRSDDVLPEEHIDNETSRLAARVVEQRISQQEAMAELDSLRAEIERLNEMQKRMDESIARVRPIQVQTPVAETNDVKPVEHKTRSVNLRREIVPMEPEHKVVARSAVAEPVTKSETPIVAKDDMTKMSPNELKKAFKKTYLSENKHLSTFTIDDRYDVASDMSSSIEGFTANRDLSETSGGVRPLEIKISFLNGDSALSRENYNLLSETASIVVNNPKRAIQIAIPESVTYNKDTRKLAARRLAIIEQVLHDTGVAEQRIIPVLSQRGDDVFMLRVISGDLFNTLTQQKRNMFGEEVSTKTYKSMSW